MSCAVYYKMLYIVECVYFFHFQYGKHTGLQESGL